MQSRKTKKGDDEEAIDFYKQLGHTCLKQRISVDIILHTKPKAMAFIDVGTLGDLCKVTSGRLKWIRTPDWEDVMKEELW